MKIYYWTVFHLLGEMRDDGEIWVVDGKGYSGTVDDCDIIAIFRVKERIFKTAEGA